MTGDGAGGDPQRERRQLAHERAAAAREQAASVHARAADFQAAHGHPDRAERERAAAEADTASAARERAAGTHDETAVDEDIDARLQRLRTNGAALLDRLDQVAESSRTAWDVGAARKRVQQLRQDLDAALDEIAGLRTAMQTRGVIEQAKGMIMVALKVNEDTAFQVLVSRSQSSHRKLVDVARTIVETGAHSPANAGR